MDATPTPDSGTMNPPPSTNKPLVITPLVPAVSPAIDQGLGQLIRLVGTWNSPSGTNSFCVMPLPQAKGATDGFILKNFAYTEELTFARIPGLAPNRGGEFTQNANTLFYEQRVYFASTNEGGDTVPPEYVNTLVHAENGSWLFLDTVKQFEGPFQFPDSKFVSNDVPPQNPQTNIAKQMSVPHGNSILAIGSVNPEATPTADGVLPTVMGVPTIPEVNTIPTFLGLPFGEGQYGPSQKDQNGIETNLNINPNYKLQEYIDNNPVTDYVHFKVTAAGQKITNIHFETKRVNVSGYTTEIWILNPNDPQNLALAYYQFITMDVALDINGEQKIAEMPHLLVNVVKFVKE